MVILLNAIFNGGVYYNLISQSKLIDIAFKLKLKLLKIDLLQTSILKISKIRKENMIFRQKWEYGKI